MSALAEKLFSEPEVAVDDYQAVREFALERLKQYGFPHQKTEAWKYTSLRSLENRDFAAEATGTVSLPEWPIDAVVLHFNHGLLATNAAELPDGLKLEPMKPDELKQRDWEGLYGREEGAFCWLNLAEFSTAWRLTVTGKQSVILAMTTSSSFEGKVHPRIRIEVAPGAELTLLEHQHDLGRGLVNVCCEIDVAAQAKVNHLIHRHNNESAWVQRTDVVIADDADYRVVAFDQGGRLTRHDLKLQLTATGSHGEIDGLVLMNGKDHVDWHTEMVHCTGHTNSREAFRMLADGASVGVFNGRIHIYADADDSHSDLNTANLLLSDQARVNIKPELEIYSEEVTASHGATIGQLDERSLFYMRSRGLSEAESLALLKYGFAAEPLMQIQSPILRDWALEKLKEVL